MDPSPPVEAFKALSDPVRWDILRLLPPEQEVDRVAVQRALSLSETMLTYHVKVLAAADLVTTEKRGRQQFYRLRSDTLAAVRQRLGRILQAAGPDAPGTGPVRTRSRAGNTAGRGVTRTSRP